jgi:cell division protein FtsB
MAKALLGYVGGSDPRLVGEMRRLRQRVRDLEDELTRMQAENDALAAAVRETTNGSFDSELLDTLDASRPEPALT